MSYKWCAVPQCKSTSISTPGKLFVCVPKNVALRTKWLQLARRNPQEIRPKSVIYFCEDHFNMQKDMSNYYQYEMGLSQRIIMKSGVLPSKFDFQEDKAKRLKERLPRDAFVKRQLLDRINEHEIIPPASNEEIIEENSNNFPTSAMGTPTQMDIKIEDEEFVCPDPPSSQDTKDSAKDYYSISEFNTNCFDFDDSVDDDDDDDDEEHECTLCEKVFQSKKLFKAHLKQHGKLDGWLSDSGEEEEFQSIEKPETETMDLQSIALNKKKSKVDEENQIDEKSERYHVNDGAKSQSVNSLMQVKPAKESREQSEEYRAERKRALARERSRRWYLNKKSLSASKSGLLAANETQIPGPSQKVDEENQIDEKSRRNHEKKRAKSPPENENMDVQSIASSKEKRVKRTAYNPTMESSRASTSGMSFDEARKLIAPNWIPETESEYRKRLAASKTPEQKKAAQKLAAARQRRLMLRKAAKLALTSASLQSTNASACRSEARSDDVQTGTQRQQLLTHQQRQKLTAATESAQIPVQPDNSSYQIKVQQAHVAFITKWAFSIDRFKSSFLKNDFGHACSICDRLWFKNHLKPITATQMEVISKWFTKENRRLCKEEYDMACLTCRLSLNKKYLPRLAKVHGFQYPDQPPGLPPLDPISERLISPCLPFMQVRRLRHHSSYGIIGQMLNVPVDIQEMVKFLPRQLNDDDVINVNFNRMLAHKSSNISEYISKSTISAWLTALQRSPLYRQYEINVDLSRLHPPTVPFPDDNDDRIGIENISAENTPESELFASTQQTMLWNEEDFLNIALRHQATSLNTIYDGHAEELSFPSIYFGEGRQFDKSAAAVTPYMIASSEIRRRDRRGATPQKILYVAMKILRLSMADKIHSAFRNVADMENVTEFLKAKEKEYGIENLAFLKILPNSDQYWASRKRDLFAMFRQLGKPTVHLTISANEIGWMSLLTTLLKLSKKYPGKTAKDLNTSECCTLVNEDPVTCCIYFDKLIHTMMLFLKSKQGYNPFGEYFVKEYFLRFEFQPSGSPRAHILLWLNDDPRETVSEYMIQTIHLMEQICSVARDDVPNDSAYAHQIHKHTFVCTKPGETICKFGFPHWPMTTTRVLVPLPQCDGRHQALQQKAKELYTSLEQYQYSSCMDDFLNVNGLTYDSYLDIVRSTLNRPTLLFKRNFDELMTNTFNPYLAGQFNSKIDIQFILDEQSCAEYLVEYFNKSVRGTGNLRREILTMMQEHPDQDHTGQLRALSMKLLNGVEMSAQEAAWYLLRQPMCKISLPVVYIPTMRPTERRRYRKRHDQMDREGIDGGDTTDVWAKNIIQRYEERAVSLEQMYLAEFASWYAKARDFVYKEHDDDDDDDVHKDDEGDNVYMDDDEDSEAVSEAKRSRVPKEKCRRRQLGRVIRYRRYDINDTFNYKREMVLLYVQFRNEMSEIVDQNKFLKLFDDNNDKIMERRNLFERNSYAIENVMKEIESKMILKNDDNSNLQQKELIAVSVQRLLGEDGVVPPKGSQIVKKTSNVMTRAQKRNLKN